MRRLFALAASLLLAGCLGRVEVSQLGALRDQALGTPAAKPTLWYVGVGLYDETWSENDVAELAGRLEAGATGFHVEPIILSNRAGRYQPATRDNVVAATDAISRQAKPGDATLLYVSSHGAPGLLGRERSGREAEPVRADELRDWLAPVRAMPTVLVISACFSGSLIPPLAADNRVIVTAARADRSSFGCRAGAVHTLFGQALLDAFQAPGESLHAAVDQLRGEVAALERKQGITRPSEPQVVVGTDARALFDTPSF